MPSIIKVDQIQSDQGFVNVSSNLQFSSGFTMLSPTIATPTFTGQATIPTINLTGGRIIFPGTQSSSSDPNTLDDYEEGTWTPTIESDSPGTGRVTSVGSATYTKIGRQVTAVGFNVQLTTLGTGGSGVLVINGLPFAEISSVSSGTTVNFSWVDQLATAASGWTGVTNGARIICRPVTASSTGPIASNAGFSTYAKVNTYFSFSVTYQTD